MEVIRKEARLQAEGSNGDLQQYKVMLSQYEAIFEHIEKKHREEIERKVLLLYYSRFTNLRLRMKNSPEYWRIAMPCRMIWTRWKKHKMSFKLDIVDFGLLSKTCERMKINIRAPSLNTNNAWSKNKSDIERTNSIRKMLSDSEWQNCEYVHGCEY